MASDKTTIIIDADASGVSSAVDKADKSLGKLGDSVKSQDQNLNRYGEKLGKAFGPGEGLHGRLDNLESPLRDTEGAIARSQMAFIEFGNKGATAADKVGAGFLLAGDAIAAFTSGGTVGVAIAAAVAGFSLINSLMTEEAEAAKKAAEEQEKHAKSLQDLGKRADDAGMSIAALQAKEAAGIALGNLRAVEQERLDQRLRQRKLKDELEDLRDRERRATTAFGKEGTQALQAQMVVKAAELKSQNEVVKGMKNKLALAKTGAKEAQAFYLNDLMLSSQSAVTTYAEALKKTRKETAATLMNLTDETTAATAKAAESARADNKKVFDEEAHEREVARDNRLFDLNEERNAKQIALEIAREEAEEKAQIREWSFNRAFEAQKKLQEAEKKAAEQRKQMALSAAQVVTGALFEQAKAGELNAAKLLEAVLNSTGQQLVSRGTLHLFEGIASSNPVEASTGGAMIAAGLAMGAASGAISRAGEPSAAAAPESSGAPTDTRESRAASGSRGGDGGTTIIHFNGPAYDRSGVSKVITSGQRMAKHRRIAGA